MGILNLRNDPYNRHIIKDASPIGLKLDADDKWEVHGPHEDMNYQVYVGTRS